MTGHLFEIAGVRVELRFHASPPAVLHRYEPFACPEGGPAQAVLDLVPGELRGLDGFTGHVLVREGALRVQGAEHLGRLDLATGQGFAIADRTLVVADSFVRALVARHAAARGGVLLHAAAVRVDGRVHLAPGPSGAGKSTFAACAGEALTDELAVVVPDAAGSWMVHGTPWWEARGGSAALEAVYALAWGGESVEPLPAAGLLRHLVTSTVLPVDGPAERARAFAACCAIARSVPFRRVAFKPATRVDALLRGEAGRSAA